jgi:HEAT repeat protein
MSAESRDFALIADATRDADTFVRARAVEALPGFQGNRVLELLEVALKDKDPLVVAVAYTAVRKTGRTVAPMLMRLLHSSTNENTRAFAATSLPEMKLPEALIPLRAAALNDTSFQVRAAASSALAKLGDSTGREVLRQTAAGSDAKLKFHALVALCDLGERVYLDALRDTFLNADERLQIDAFAAARTATNCPVRPIVDGLVTSPYSSLRSFAMDAIAANATAADLPLLRSGVGSNDESVRFMAARSLVMLGDASGIPIVETTLRSRNPSLRAAAVKALAAVGDRRSQTWTQVMLQDQSSPVLLAAIEAAVQLKNESATSPLEKLVSAGNFIFSGEAADALVSLSGDAALPFLLETLQSPNSFSRIYAAGAILKLRPQ